MAMEFRGKFVVFSLQFAAYGLVISPDGKNERYGRTLWHS